MATLNMNFRDRHHARGISLLEVLCVIAISAALIIGVMHHVRSTTMQNDLQRIPYDTKQLFSALQLYVHNSGCQETAGDDNGQLHASLRPDITETLQLFSTSPLPLKRYPLIMAYTTHIAEDINSQAYGPKYWHHLVIQAQLTPMKRQHTRDIASQLKAKVIDERAGIIAWQQQLDAGTNNRSLTQQLRNKLQNMSRHQLSINKKASYAACWKGDTL